MASNIVLLYLSPFLSISLSFSLSLSYSLFVSLFRSLSLSLSYSLCVSLSISICLPLSLCLYVSLSLFQSLSLSFFISFSLSLSLSLSLSHTELMMIVPHSTEIAQVRNQSFVGFLKTTVIFQLIFIMPKSTKKRNKNKVHYTYFLFQLNVQTKNKKGVKMIKHR